MNLYEYGYFYYSNKEDAESSKSFLNKMMSDYDFYVVTRNGDSQLIATKGSHEAMKLFFDCDSSSRKSFFSDFYRVTVEREEELSIIKKSTFSYSRLSFDNMKEFQKFLLYAIYYVKMPLHFISLNVQAHALKESFIDKNSQCLTREFYCYVERHLALADRLYREVSAATVAHHSNPYRDIEDKIILGSHEYNEKKYPVFLLQGGND